MRRHLLYCAFIFQSSFAYANESVIKDKIGPYIVSIIGQERAKTWFDIETHDIKMPDLTQLKKTNKKTIEYQYKKKNESIDQKKKARYDELFVREVFLAIRNFKAQDKDLVRWLNVLKQGGSREGVYRALILDHTYKGLENFDKPINDSVVDFAISFMDIYLGHHITQEKIDLFNFYTLKRLVAEKSLEIFDELFVRDEEEAYNWYALFSADIAKKFKKSWKNEVRINESPEFHRNWAKAVPLQHIKSEIFIKVHLSFNGLIQ